MPCELLSVSVVGNPLGSGIPSLSPQPGARSLPDLSGETFVLSDAPAATAGSCLPRRMGLLAFFGQQPLLVPTGGSHLPRGGGCQAQRLMEKLDESMKNFAA